MKIYFRLLSFAKPIGKFAFPYFIFTLLYALFNTLVFSLLMPVLNVLFKQQPGNRAESPLHSPSFDWSFQYFSDLFNYHFNTYIHENGQKGALIFVAISLVICVLLSNVFRYLSQRIMENLRIYTLQNLRKTVFESVTQLHLHFFNSERKGDIIAKITSDVQVVQFSVTNTLQVIIREPLLIIGYMYLLFTISAQLTLFTLLLLPVSGLVIGRIVKSLRAQATEAQSSFGVMVSQVDEAISGMRIVKAFNALPYIHHKFNSENDKYSNINKSIAKRQQMASPVSEFLGVLTLSGILIYGGSLVFENHSSITAAGFITYIAAFSQLLRPAKAISDSFSNINQGLAAGERVLDLIDTKPSILDIKNAELITDFKINLVFNHVDFSYGEKTILRNINLTIPKGKTVALVGPSGGGKSTLLDLIPRFSDPMAGEIFIDGKDIKALSQDSLRNLMGVVNQESILFNDSIYNNIVFGREGFTQQQVEEAAKIANAHDFILKTDEGYETNIGDRGIKLSGGQKQRICIARAVLGNPPIMLLDEATSALDTESEKLVQEALDHLMQNRTTVVIAHRLSTIQNADLIVVIEAGEIIEQGSHSELIQHNGLYKKLISMQTFES
ncbi:MAG: ABC transporter ATP-binding protein/permease [Bacteroidetes bacterium]|nr:ABC transporter ATP-binding protein/permease [Bacteroidota bacterium]MBU1371864.1 ABC transporter ATP-binding protein/permease [Bacteroidota bacterium]MBU1483251.1 ABC transporter ATP-binding protein/permease [Bacteroidota bacterium]MBU1761884.1 ABC transporter ATP-binding protein/permease [Bacteroidota bacterium]MBU2268832.1 ABC transporter ATP-binding protein/permease [Bacteroidota bacterium]